MAIGTRIGPDGRPIDESFFGGGGLGQQLASLPGTPVLPGAATPPPAIGGYENPSAQAPLAGGGSTPPGQGMGEGGLVSTGIGTGPNWRPSGLPGTGGAVIQRPDGTFSENTFGRTGIDNILNPGTPPPTSTAGVTQPGGGFFGGTNPFQTGVTGSMNNQSVPFNSNQYVTPEAAQRLGSLLGANVVSQNTQGMASPGSGAPSAPLLGLDFGTGGDVQDAAMGATQLARGDRPEDVAARYKAGLTTKAWAGDQPVPQLAEAWDAPYWNRANPVSTNTPNAQQAGFFGQGGGSPDQQEAFFTWLRGQLGGQA